jgi:hypothetical protein
MEMGTLVSSKKNAWEFEDQVPTRPTRRTSMDMEEQRLAPSPKSLKPSPEGDRPRKSSPKRQEAAVCA